MNRFLSILAAIALCVIAVAECIRAYDTRQIARDIHRMEGRDFDNAWELAYLSRSLVDQVVYYSRSDSLKAAALERHEEFEKIQGVHRKFEMWKRR